MGTLFKKIKRKEVKMQLRNKKTGEIGWLETYYEKMIAVLDKKSEYHHYNSLSELNDEWEDYEEPKDKGYWYMDDLGRIQFSSEVLDELEDHPNNLMIRKLYGNYFETREEAEKAVEKLRCFTNLKNHEFMFDGWYYGADGNIVILANAHEFNDMEEQDLTKVFGEKIC